MNSINKKISSALIGVFGLAGAGLADSPARLTALHGIPGLPEPVEVYVNGAPAFSFDFLGTVGPLDLPEGTYHLEVRLQGTPVLNATVPLASGVDYSVIAHETFINGVDSGFKLSLFENDRTRPPLFFSKATVRHTADAPAVDIGLNLGGFNALTIENLANPDAGDPGQAGPVVVIPADYTVTFAPAGTTDVVFDAEIRVNPNLNYVVYAVGSIFDGTFTLLPQLVRPMGCDAADLDRNGTVHSGDFIVFLNSFVRGGAIADFNFDGQVNSADFIDFLNVFSACIDD